MRTLVKTDKETIERKDVEAKIKEIAETEPLDLEALAHHIGLLDWIDNNLT
jgi:hypothetical protein